MIIRDCFLIGSLLCLFAVTSFSQGVDFEKRLDGFADKIQKDLQIQTGFAVGLVKNGELILHKRYGFLNIEEKTPIAENTPFYIASTTKSFVGLLAVILADKGFFKLDEPISKYLPELKFDDKRIQPDKITIRNLLNHTHGIANFVVQFNTAYSGVKISDRDLLESFQKDSTFTNNNFAYSNLGYILAGVIIKKTTGKTWQENLKKYVLKPAKMNSTSPYVSDFAKNKLPSAHHSYRRENRIVQSPFIKVNETMHAAGGMLSTIADSAKWIILNQNQGKFKGVQVFPQKYFAELSKSSAELKATFFNYERNRYGIGWYQAKMDKYLMIHSFGGFTGARSHISFLPEQNSGVCIFIAENGRGANVPDMIANYIYGMLLNDENVIKTTENELNRQTKAFQEAIAQPTLTRETINLSPEELVKLSSNYSHPTLGTLSLRILDGKVYLKFGNIKTFMQPNTKTLLTSDFPHSYRFEFSEKGIEMLDDNVRYLFVKIAK